MTFNEDRPSYRPTSVVGQVIEFNHRLIDMLAPEPEILRFPLLLDPEPEMVAHESPLETEKQMIYRKINALNGLRATMKGVGLEMYEYRDSQDKDRYWIIQRDESDLYVTERYRVNSAGTITDVEAFLSTDMPRRYHDILELKRFKQNVMAAPAAEVSTPPSKLRKWGSKVLGVFTDTMENPPQRRIH